MKDSERSTIAYGIVGWLNLIALLLIGFIVASAMGYTIRVPWWGIVIGLVLTFGVFFLFVYLLVKAPQEPVLSKKERLAARQAARAKSKDNST